MRAAARTDRPSADNNDYMILRMLALNNDTYVPPLAAKLGTESAPSTPADGDTTADNPAYSAPILVKDYFKTLKTRLKKTCSPTRTDQDHLLALSGPKPRRRRRVELRLPGGDRRGE